MTDRLPNVGGHPQPPATDDRLGAQMAFLVEIDQMKNILRQNIVISGERRENDAEHSWHLALMTLVLAEYANEPIDVARTVTLVLVHDLVEIYAGDTFLYDDAGAADQAEREQAAADRLFALLPPDQESRLRGLWDEFEVRATPEARFAKAMDRLQPTLLNYCTRGGTWRAPGVGADDVLGRKAVIGDGAEQLWEYARALIETGAANGWMDEA